MDDQNLAEYSKKNPLYAVLNPAYEQREGQYYPGQSATVGYSAIKDTAKVNRFLRETRSIFPRDIKLVWMNQPRVEGSGVLELLAIKVTNRDQKAALGGEVITNARQDYDQNGRVEVSMSMNAEGAKIWKRLTGENIGRQVAIVLDDYKGDRIDILFMLLKLRREIDLKIEPHPFKKSEFVATNPFAKEIFKTGEKIY